jgi:tyrosyl-tRNA synthetase
VHGRAAAEQAAETARKTFEEGEMAEALPTLELTRAQIDAGFGVLTANTQLGFTSSNSQARQLVKDGAVHLGAKQITDPSYKITIDDFEDGRVLLKTGPKKRAILTVKPE